MPRNTAQFDRWIRTAFVDLNTELDENDSLVDRILRAKYSEADPSVDKAWQDETRRRIADMESGKVQGVPLEETLAKVSTQSGQIRAC